MEETETRSLEQLLAFAQDLVDGKTPKKSEVVQFAKELVALKVNFEKINEPAPADGVPVVDGVPDLIEEPVTAPLPLPNFDASPVEITVNANHRIFLPPETNRWYTAREAQALADALGRICVEIATR